MHKKITNKVMMLGLLCICTIEFGLYFGLFLHGHHTNNKLAKISATGCIQPTFNAHDQLMMKLTKRVEACHEPLRLTYTNNNALFFSALAVKIYGKFNCNVTEFKRHSDYYNDLGRTIRDVQNGSKISFELFAVDCRTKNMSHREVHMTIVNKIYVADRGKMSRKNPSDVMKPNVMIIGLDSVSRLAWLRELPLTRKYFMNSLDGVELEGYNVVGDGTPAALLPLLTGKHQRELPDARSNHNNTNFVDIYPWIWKDFKRHGYITHWTEDSPMYGTFTYGMNGFNNTPADFYMRPFYLLEMSNIFIDCSISMSHFNIATDWIYDIFKSFPHTPKFSFTFLSEFSHDSYALKEIDEVFSQVLENLKNHSYLDNTILILMSDHGARFTELRQTVRGKIEERMPYFALSIPQSIRIKYPRAIENIQANTKLLVTPFDIHATFLHLLSGDMDKPLKKTLPKRAISLFERIPLTRTCQEIEIPPHWCTCLTEIPMTDTAIGFTAALSAVAFMNGLLKKVATLCETIFMKKLHSCTLYETSKEVLTFKQSGDDHGETDDLSDDMVSSTSLIRLDVETYPGGARYELTTQYDSSRDHFSFDVKQISRMNKYGSAPYCILKSNFELRSYCYCKGFSQYVKKRGQQKIKST